MQPQICVAGSVEKYINDYLNDIQNHFERPLRYFDYKTGDIYQTQTPYVSLITPNQYPLYSPITGEYIGFMKKINNEWTFTRN